MAGSRGVGGTDRRTGWPLRQLALAIAVLLASSSAARAQAIKVGSFAKTGGASQTVPHALGQVPKALILWTDGKTAPGVFSTDFLYAYGMTDGTTSKSAAMASRTIGAAPVAVRRMANKALTIVDWTSTVLAEADLGSWDATNFTLNWTTNNATGYIIHFIAIGGPAVSAKLVGWTMPTAPGSKAVTGVGFTPDVVLHAHIGDGFVAAPPANQNIAHFGLGAMDNSGGQWAVNVESTNGVASGTTRGQQTNACIYGTTAALAVAKRAAFQSMDVDGFTVNFSVANAFASQVVSLALKGVSAKAGSFLKSTTAPPAASYVQSNSQTNSSSSVTSLAVTLPAASTTGNLIVVSLSYARRTPIVSSVTDNKGNTYLRALGPTDYGTGTDRAYTYYARNITGGGAPIQVTATLSGGNSNGFFELYATEYQGIDTVAPLDQTSETLGTGNPVTSAAVTTTAPDEILYAFCDGQSGGITLNAPFTTRMVPNGNPVGDASVTSIGSYSLTGTITAGNWGCHLLSFRHFGTRQAITGVGMSPSAVMLASFQDVPQAGPVVHDRFGLGAADRAFGQGAIALADLDASNPTSVQGVDFTNRAFVKVNNNTSSTDAEAALYSMDAGGFTLDWTKNDAVGTQILYLALAAKPSSYSRFRSITVPTSSLGASCTTSLTSFPLLVNLSGDLELRTASDGGYVQSASGYDIVFTDAYNNLLDHEIEQYTSAPAGATLVAWVRLPTLSTLGPTTIFMRYGNASITTPTANPAGVWDSSYKAVWHLKETGAGAAGEYKDSTANGNNGQGGGGGAAAVPARVAGAIGFGQSFDGTNDFIDAGTNAVLNITGPITLEGWVQLKIPRSTVGAAVVGRGNNPQYFLYHDFDADYRMTFHANTAAANFPQASPLAPNTWYFVVGTYSGTASSLYLNGARTESWADVSPITAEPGARVKIGTVDASPDFFNGPLDEVRISTTPRSSCWIETEYKNVTVAGFSTFGTPTAVQLMSFDALAQDRAVLVSWRTGSELANLGFHLYRSLSENGPWSRLDATLIPGLGSSAVGQAYSWNDTGLQNGTRYVYRLEDVDASSKVTSHGPVSAVPTAAAVGAGTPSPAPAPKGRTATAPSCPAWVVSAYGSLVASAPTASPVCTRHGDPEAVSLQVVSRDARGATLELSTGGFYALHEASGKVRVFVPGFDFPDDPQAVALPFRRALVEGVVGRRAHLAGTRALDQVGFPGLIPSALGKAEMQVSPDGVVSAGRRDVRGPRELPASADLARLLPSVFQGEAKSAVVAISPLRYDARRRQLLLAKRVLVRLLFTARETGESGRGGLGRRVRPQPAPPVADTLLARLYTQGRGLYAVTFEQLFPGRSRGLAASRLRLERQGAAAGFHLEPSADSFGPGGVLFFYADGQPASTDFASDLAWELFETDGGLRIPLVQASPSGAAVATSSLGTAVLEQDRFYQPGLLEAPDLWLWDAVASGAVRVKSFSLAGVDATSARGAALDVFLQCASESGNPIDHHVSVALNGVVVGEAQFARKLPYRMSLSVPAGVLREGSNELSLVNVGDTGVTSVVFLDRFAVSYPQLSSLASGHFEGTWSESGIASVGGVAGAVALLDVTSATRGSGVSWLTGFQTTGGALRFRAEAGRRYLAVAAQGLLTPRVAAPSASTLRATHNQADYVLITPRAFLPAAEPLLARRQDQGLQARAVAFEEIADEFGHGQPSAEAIRSFIAYAYQSWARPSPRYVLLLGDASYDPRNFMGSSLPSPLPTLWMKTSYLWTAADPLLAAVNGEDALPDLAIGRLPATTVEEAQRLVEKLIAWEDSGQGLLGTAVLVADNPDPAGDFEANARDIQASFLSGRSELLLLSELGAGTRPAVQAALDSGLSYLDYIGHGGAAVWASENVWNSWDAASLRAQSRQPLLLTLDCLNGYFVAPSYDSLAESLVKADGRGAIAAISPSGLSLDEPAHQYHRALMAELTSGRHQRLGDAVLAAQQTYAQTGLMPELLSVYHLFGDPATPLR